MIQSTSVFKPNVDTGARIMAGVSAGVARAASLVEEEAKQNAPVDTGELRDSIAAQSPEQDRDVRGTGNAVTAIVSVSAPHAPFVEYGTGERGAESPGHGDGPYSPTWAGMPAQPYMRPAIDTRKQDVLQAIAEEVRSAT